MQETHGDSDAHFNYGVSAMQGWRTSMVWNLSQPCRCLLLYRLWLTMKSCNACRCAQCTIASSWQNHSKPVALPLQCSTL